MHVEEFRFTTPLLVFYLVRAPAYVFRPIPDRATIQSKFTLNFLGIDMEMVTLNSNDMFTIELDR